MSRLRRLLSLLPLLLLIGTAASAQEPDRARSERNVVGIRVTFQGWNEDRPWLKLQSRTRSASGVLIDDLGHVLTTAQVIEGATLIRLETFGRAHRLEPSVVYVDRTLNLAVLRIEDPQVLERLEPVELAKRTPTSGRLWLTRWRGQQLETSSSRIHRFEVQQVWGARAHHAFLHLQTDQESGGWADPVFDGNAFVGLSVSQRQSISRVIPIEMIRRFLDQRDGKARQGLATLGATWQVNRDESVSRFLEQNGDPTGILIRQVPWGSTGCGTLKPRDILLEVAGHPIDAEGFYRHPRFGRLRFHQIFVEDFPPGATVPVRVWREAEVLDLEMTARPYPSALDRIPAMRFGPPPFVVAGGLVIRELDVRYLATWGNEWAKDAPISLTRRYYYEQESQSPAQRRFVMITSVLPSAYNVGYQGVGDDVILTLNGRAIGKIEDVFAALKHPQDGFHVFELAAEASRRQVVLDAVTFEQATAEIVAEYSVALPGRSRETPLPEGGGACGH